MGKRSERERQQRRKYYRAMEEQREQEGERLTALGMLLDAVWDEASGCFVQRTARDQYPIHCFYDKHGNVIPKPPKRNLW